MSGADTAQAAEKRAGAADVGGDLRAEFFGAGEFSLGAEMAPEFELNAFGVDGTGEIEQVCFDGERGAIEGGAHADVGDGATRACFAFEQCACDIDAASGQQFLLGLKI